MATTNPWPLIHAEREALIADLGTLTGDQWATPSLCDGWTVRDVLGHMIATAKMSQPAFFVALAGAGFRFNAMNQKNIAQEATPNPSDGLAEFRRHLKDTSHPPGPVEAMLGEGSVRCDALRVRLAQPHRDRDEHRLPGDRHVVAERRDVRKAVSVGGRDHPKSKERTAGRFRWLARIGERRRDVASGEELSER